MKKNLKRDGIPMYEFGERRFIFSVGFCLNVYLTSFSFFLPKELHTGMHDLRLVWSVETVSIATLNRLD